MNSFSYLAQGRLGFGPKGLLFRYMLHNLRTWDTRTAHGPDLMLANSSYVRSRIQRIYVGKLKSSFRRLPSTNLNSSPAKTTITLRPSFLAPYKRTDLVIRAFNDMPSRRLVVVGEGQQSQSLRAWPAPT